jgi:hypothetical protein
MADLLADRPCLSSRSHRHADQLDGDAHPHGVRARGRLCRPVPVDGRRGGLHRRPDPRRFVQLEAQRPVAPAADESAHWRWRPGAASLQEGLRRQRRPARYRWRRFLCRRRLGLQGSEWQRRVVRGDRDPRRTFFKLEPCGLLASRRLTSSTPHAPHFAASVA